MKLSNSIGAPNQPHGKIVGGFPLNITQAPWQVAIQSDEFFQFCGGSIIGARWILTSAHCVEGETVSSIHIRVGATHKFNDGQVIYVEEIIIHEQFLRPDYDYGLIKLKTSLQFTDKVQPISLPNIGDAPIATGTVCFVSGWGHTKNASESSLTLRGVEMPIVNQNICRRAYPYSPFTKRMVCVGVEEGGKSCKFYYQQILYMFQTLIPFSNDSMHDVQFVQVTLVARLWPSITKRRSQSKLELLAGEKDVVYPDTQESTPELAQFGNGLNPKLTYKDPTDDLSQKKYTFQMHHQNENINQ